MNLSLLLQQAGQRPTPYISIVIPIFNEVENVQLLYHSLRSAMDPTGHSWEIVFVDDGSTDGTGPALREIHVQQPGVWILELRRNFGQTAAMAAGFDHACGRS